MLVPKLPKRRIIVTYAAWTCVIAGFGTTLLHHNLINRIVKYFFHVVSVHFLKSENVQLLLTLFLV